jgi:hypothetical protein
MQKALFYIVASENERERAVIALNMARRAHEFKRFADVKIIMQGSSQKLLLDEDKNVKENIDYLISNNVIDSACTFIAKNLSIEEKIQSRGVELKPAGERLSAFVNDGYVPLVF